MNEGNPDRSSLSPNLIAKIQAAIDNELVDEELVELEAELRSNPTAMRHYLLAAHLSTDLRLLALEKESLAQSLQAIETLPDPEPDLETTRESEQRSPKSPWLAITLQTITQPTSLSLILAGAFVTAVILILAVFTVPGWQRDPHDVAGFERRTVARVMMLQDVVWADDAMEWKALMPIENGEAVQLKSGVVEIRFENGATTLLEGPATLVAINEQAGRLNSGRILSQVPPAAVGFTIVTKAATFRDLGTEFGVLIREDEAAVAVVHEGKIEVTAAKQKQNSQVLLAGDSCVVTLSGDFEEATVEPSFVHDLELGGHRGQPVKGLRYEYVGDNSKPEIAKHSGDGYRDDQRTELVDGKLATEDYQDPNWVAWYQTAGADSLPQPAIDFALPAGLDVEKVATMQVSYLVGHGAGVHAPDRVVISASENGKDFIRLQEYSGFDDTPTTAATNCRSASIPLQDLGPATTHVRAEFFNDQEWTFLSEVRFLQAKERSETSAAAD